MQAQLRSAAARGVAALNPRRALPLALRSAAAAVAAWLVVQPMPGVADEYPYYAPLGAVVAVSTTVLISLRTSVQTFLALAAGAVVGAGALVLWGPGALALGLTVAVGTLLSMGRWFGSMASWVPVSALFVLMLGQDRPGQFVLGYLGLTSLGALVGAATNLAFPPLMLAQVEHAQHGLRCALVEHLDALARALEDEAGPEDLTRSVGDTGGRGREIQDLVTHAVNGPPVNWRLHRWQERADRLRERGRALTMLAYLTSEMAGVISGDGTVDRLDSPERRELRAPAAHALRAVADVLRSGEDSPVPETVWVAARTCVDELRQSVRELRDRTGEDLFAVGALVDAVERSLVALTPRAG